MDQNSIITIYSDSESDNPEQTPLPREKTEAEKDLEDRMAKELKMMLRGRRHRPKQCKPAPKKAKLESYIVISDSQ